MRDFTSRPDLGDENDRNRLLDSAQELLDSAQDLGGDDHFDFDIVIWNPVTELDEDISDVKWAHDLRKDSKNTDGVIRLVAEKKK